MNTAGEKHRVSNVNKNRQKDEIQSGVKHRYGNVHGACKRRDSSGRTWWGSKLSEFLIINISGATQLVGITGPAET